MIGAACPFFFYTAAVTAFGWTWWLALALLPACFALQLRNYRKWVGRWALPTLQPPASFLDVFENTFLINSKWSWPGADRFAWVFLMYQPMIELALVFWSCYFVQDQDAFEQGNNTDVWPVLSRGPTWASRYFIMTNLLTWGLIATGVLLFGSWRLGEFHNQAWDEDKTRFEAQNGRFAGMVDRIWVKACAKATHMTKGSVGVLLVCVVYSVLSAAAALYGWLHLLGLPHLRWPMWRVVAIAIISFANSFFFYYGLFQWFFCSVACEYLKCIHTLKLLVSITDAREAKLLGLTCIPLDNVQNVCPSILAFTLLCMSQVAVILVFNLIFNQGLFHGPWLWFTVIGQLLSIDEAVPSDMECAAEKGAPEELARLVKALQAVKKGIENEVHCPHVVLVARSRAAQLRAAVAQWLLATTRVKHEPGAGGSDEPGAGGGAVDELGAGGGDEPGAGGGADTGPAASVARELPALLLNSKTPETRSLNTLERDL
eukprot:g3804.t1